jgi:hypothetical protein
MIFFDTVVNYHDILRCKDKLFFYIVHFFGCTTWTRLSIVIPCGTYRLFLASFRFLFRNETDICNDERTGLRQFEMHPSCGDFWFVYNLFYWYECPHGQNPTVSRLLNKKEIRRTPVSAQSKIANYNFGIQISGNRSVFPPTS